MKFKTRINELMKDRGWMPLDLQEHAGVSVATAYKLSRDEVCQMDLTTLAKLCEAFSVPVERIIVPDGSSDD